MSETDAPVALITGGSSGLGCVIAETFVRAGYRVVIIGRDQRRLDQVKESLESIGDAKQVVANVADLTNESNVLAIFDSVERDLGCLDVLVNCVGKSDRGLIETLKPDRLNELFEVNVTTALLCSQAAIPLLEQSKGAIVNIGSLGAKVGARYLGGYAIVKHALAGMTQQLRLELKPKGIHVGLVNPGPIRRDDGGTRYASQVDDRLPAQANQPGGGTTLKGLDPHRVAEAVLRCAQRRQADRILPSHLRCLIALGHVFPALGDWLLLKFTSNSK